MVSFKLKQIGLALCLMASLLIGNSSACTCSRHDEAKASENDCHSHHESAENADIAETDNAVDDSCICIVQQPSPYLGSRSVSKELKSNDPVANSEQIIPDPEFVATTRPGGSSLVFASNLSYSNTVESLLPARAPPRL